MGIVIETDCHRLILFKKLKPIARFCVDTSHDLSMRGVGIVLGIVGQALRRFNRDTVVIGFGARTIHVDAQLDPAPAGAFAAARLVAGGGNPVAYHSPYQRSARGACPRCSTRGEFQETGVCPNRVAHGVQADAQIPSDPSGL